MLAVSSLAATSWAPAAAPMRATPMRSSSVTMETKEDLVALAKDLNPVVGYWDPLKLADQEFWGQSQEATIGFLRESEIKHGRIAMFGFVGYIVHENDIRTQGDAIAAAVPTGLSAPAVWDALPEIAKWQIILFVGVMESLRENKSVLAGDGEKHYMRGGKPGYFPTFDMVPHPTPFNLYDPWGVMKNKSEESKARGRLVRRAPPPSRLPCDSDVGRPAGAGGASASVRFTHHYPGSVHVRPVDAMLRTPSPISLARPPGGDQQRPPRHDWPLRLPLGGDRAGLRSPPQGVRHPRLRRRGDGALRQKHLHCLSGGT